MVIRLPQEPDERYTEAFRPLLPPATLKDRGAADLVNTWSGVSPRYPRSEISRCCGVLWGLVMRRTSKLQEGVDLPGTLLKLLLNVYYSEGCISCDFLSYIPDSMSLSGNARVKSQYLEPIPRMTGQLVWPCSLILVRGRMSNMATVYLIQEL